MIDGRRTGRTTRMLVEVLKAQQDPHRRPIVIVGNSASIPYVKRLYAALGGDPRTLKVTMDSRRADAHARDDVFVDHYFRELGKRLPWE